MPSAQALHLAPWSGDCHAWHRHLHTHKHNLLDQPGSQYRRIDLAAVGARVKGLARALDHAHSQLACCAGVLARAATARPDGMPARRAVLQGAAAACEMALLQLRLPLLQLGVQQPPGGPMPLWRYVLELLSLHRWSGCLAGAEAALEAVLDAHAAALQDTLPQALRQLLESQSTALAAHHGALCRLCDEEATGISGNGYGNYSGNYSSSNYGSSNNSGSNNSGSNNYRSNNCGSSHGSSSNAARR